MKGKSKRPHGQMRQSQLVTTFGPGSMLDLPNYSVLVAGLDHWRGVTEEIIEPRLVEKLLRPARVSQAQPPAVGLRAEHVLHAGFVSLVGHGLLVVGGVAEGQHQVQVGGCQALAK